VDASFYETLYLWLRRSHIFVGVLGLVAFWIPVIAKKGGRAHIIAGRVFEWCGYYVATTALFACARYLLTPHHFAFVDRPDITAEQLHEIRFAQFFLTLLAYLACLFLVQLRNGMRVVRTRHLPAEGYRNWEAKFWIFTQTVASLWLISYGAYRLFNGGSSVHWVSIAVPLIPLSELKKELRFLNNPREEKMGWWYKHMDCMCGCGVAFHTAGLLFSTRLIFRYWEIEVSPVFQFIPWLLPTIIGAPLAHWWVKSYRKKFGDDNTRAAISRERPVTTV